MNTTYNLRTKMPIGVMDSGIGGLTVLKKLAEKLPSENYLYYGDTKNLPYGNKSPEQLLQYVREILNFFNKKNVKAVVFGCNTTSAVVYDIVKNEYPFQIYPIIQNACENIAPSKYSKIGVFATQATVNSGAYAKALKTFNQKLEILELACPNWVNFIENDEINSEKCFENVKEMMTKMQQFAPEKIILGCTHYPYLLNVLEKFAPSEMFINPASAFVDYIKNDLQKNQILNSQGGRREFFVSSNPINFHNAGQKFFELNAMPTLV